MLGYPGTSIRGGLAFSWPAVTRGAGCVTGALAQRKRSCGAGFVVREGCSQSRKVCWSREDTSERHSLLPPLRFLLVAPVTGYLQKPEGKEPSMVIWDTELGRERQRWNCAGAGLWKGRGGWGISSMETSLSLTPHTVWSNSSLFTEESHPIEKWGSKWILLKMA